MLFRAHPVDFVTGLGGELFGRGLVRTLGRVGSVCVGLYVADCGVEDVVPGVGWAGVVDGVASGFACVGACLVLVAFVGGLLGDEFVDAGA